jgi:hypothetical protein
VAGITNKGRMRGPARLLAGLAVCLALCPGPALAGRKGADIRVTLLNGEKVNGELIAVRADRIVVKSVIIESTVAIADIDTIALPATGTGSSIPRQLGIYAGIALGVFAAGAYSNWYYDKYDGIPIWSYPVGIVAGAWLGSAAGGWLSRKQDRDKLYAIGGQPPEAVAGIMAKLKRKARVRVAY